MRLSRLVFVLGASAFFSPFVVSAVSSPTSNDPYKVLTAEKFGPNHGFCGDRR
jgi:hypothetical protein